MNSVVKSGAKSKKYETIADAGSVLLGGSNFSVQINNGLGDGLVYVEVIENQKDVDDEKLSRFEFFTCIEGEFQLYDYDCGGIAIESFSGRYATYFNNGHVVIVKVD